MRINFASTYKEVQQLLKASTKPSTQADEAAFARSLGDLLLQPTEVSGENVPPLTNSTFSEPVKSSMEEVKASYRFHDPNLLMPELAPLEPPATEAIPSENGGSGVKTPTLLEARRVTLEPTRVMSELQPQISSIESMLAGEPEILQSLAPKTPTIASSEIPSVTKPPIPEVAPRTSPGINLPPQLGQKEIVSRLSLASQKIGLDPTLAMSVVRAESGFNVRAVSTDGHNSKGLFQLLDSTGKTILSRADSPSDDYDPFDPDLNIQLGTSYLRYLHDIFKTPTQLPGSLKTTAAADDKSLEQLAVAAFNAGEGRVASAQQRSERAGKDPAHYDNVAPFLPRSTREYVARVVRGKRLF